MPDGMHVVWPDDEDEASVDHVEITRLLRDGVESLMQPWQSEDVHMEAAETIRDALERPGVSVDLALQICVPDCGNITVGRALSQYCERPDANDRIRAMVEKYPIQCLPEEEKKEEEARQMDHDIVDRAIAAAAAREPLDRDIIDMDSSDSDQDYDMVVISDEEMIDDGRIPVLAARHGGVDCKTEPVEKPPEPTKPKPSTWTPGRDCRGYIDKHHTMPVQCAVLLANSVTALKEATAQDGRSEGTCGSHLRSTSTLQLIIELESRLAGRCSERADPSVKLVSSLTCLSVSTVKRSVYTTRPALQREQHKSVTVKGKKPQTPDATASKTIMRTMIRQSLANAVQGRSHGDFMGDLARIQMAGATIGEKYLQRWFTSTVEYVGALAVANVASAYVHKPLPSLGIPSDLELFFDPGTIGRVFRAVRATVVVSGVTISTPGFNNGSTAIFAGAPPNSVSQAEETKSYKLFLEGCPMGLSTAVLRSRLAITTTDGAYADGEASHHTPHSSLLRDLWDSVGRPAMIGWDEFHRWNKVHQKTALKVPLAQEFYRLVRELENVFGFGQGRLIDKQVALMAGERWLVGKAPGGTREFVYVAGIPERFLAKWRTYYEAVHVQRKKSELKKTGHDKVWWVDLGLRLSRSSMIVFTLLHRDVYQALTPQVLFVQKPGSLPDAREHGHRKAMGDIGILSSIMAKLRPWVAYMPMLRPYIGKGMMRKTVHSLVSALVGRHFRGLPPMMAGMMHNYKFQGHRISQEVREAQWGRKFVHHACQCMSRRDNEPIQRWVNWRGRRRLMYCWVLVDTVSQPFRCRNGERDPWAWFSEVVYGSWKQVPKQNQCQISSLMTQQVCQEILEAIDASTAYIQELQAQVHEYITGDVGVSRDLQTRWALNATCYSLGTLAQAAPTMAAEDAFRRLYSAAVPELRYTLKPPVSEWGVVEIPVEPPVQQYRDFASKLRQAWQEETQSFEANGLSRRGWVAEKGMMVHPLLSTLPPASRL